MVVLLRRPSGSVRSVTSELSMGWVNPRVIGLGWIELFQFFMGWGGLGRMLNAQNLVHTLHTFIVAYKYHTECNCQWHRLKVINLNNTLTEPSYNYRGRCVDICKPVNKRQRMSSQCIKQWACRLLTMDLFISGRQQQEDYPLLSQFARRIFCMSASSALSDRDFSSVGHIITESF